MIEAAPPIENIEILEDTILKIKFEGMSERYVDLKSFPLLGIAKELLTNSTLLHSFKLVDGIPEWNEQCLLGPEDLLKHSTASSPLKIAGSFSTRIKKHYMKF